MTRSELEIRRIDARLGRYELELRELEADPLSGVLPDTPHRVATLRRWIATDNDRLHELLDTTERTER